MILFFLPAPPHGSKCRQSVDAGVLSGTTRPLPTCRPTASMVPHNQTGHSAHWVDVPSLIPLPGLPAPLKSSVPWGEAGIPVSGLGMAGPSTWNVLPPDTSQPFPDFILFSAHLVSSSRRPFPIALPKTITFFLSVSCSICLVFFYLSLPDIMCLSASMALEGELHEPKSLS